jgi:hypothetical protein
METGATPVLRTQSHAPPAFIRHIENQVDSLRHYGVSSNAVAMKSGLIIGLCLFSQAVFADGLPVIMVPPASQTVSPGDTATLTVTATGATGFQWRFNGADISGATTSTLQIPNAQTNNVGYYMAVTKNATGWVPSQMAWLSVVSGSGGVVPFSNKTNNYFAGQACDYDGNPLNNCSAQVVAGPALDQMQPVGLSTTVVNGYYGFSSTTRTVSTVAPGQDVYYRVDIAPTSRFDAQSTVMKLTAGGGGFPIPSFPTPSVYGLKFPGWWVGEGLEPFIDTGYPNTSTNQVRIPGETFSLINSYFAYTDYGIPTAQWRKNGNPIIGATNFPNIEPGWIFAGEFQGVLTITNVQPADAGIYDLVVIGNDWIVGPKTVLSIQITNGPGVFQYPQFRGTNFVCNLLGVAGRNYAIQWSTNLTDWHNFATQYNSTGTITFTNPPALGGAQFYRGRLLP